VLAANRREFLLVGIAGAAGAPAQVTPARSQRFLAGLVPGGRGRAPSSPISSAPAAAVVPAKPPTPAERIEYYWRACDECATLGVHHIEVNTTHTGLAQTYLPRLEEFREEMSKRDVRLLGLAMYAHLHDTSSLASMIEDHLRVARFLQRVGGRYIAELIAPAAHLGNGDDESYRKVDVRAVISSCNEIGKRVRGETGIQIGYHPEQGDIRWGIWNRLVDGTDPRYYSFWPDVGHLQACGVDPLKVYKDYRERMVGTHLRDYAPEAGEAPGGQPRRGRMVPFGEGVIKLPALVQFLKDTDFAGSVMGEGGGTQAMRNYMAGTLGLKL
jgi:sugar phosphate isomerase/epimerase